MIYFIETPSGSIKIGTTEDVDARFSQLHTHYRKPLRLLSTMPGGREVEGEIHARFAHLRLGRTEQFRPGSDLMEFIGSRLLVGINPDAVEALPKGRPEISLTLSPKDHDRLERASEARGLSKSSYARMGVLALIRQDEETKGSK